MLPHMWQICRRSEWGLQVNCCSTSFLFCSLFLCFSFFLHCMIALGTHFQGYTSGCTSSLGDIDYACITGIDLESEDLGGK